MLFRNETYMLTMLASNVVNTYAPNLTSLHLSPG